MFSDMKLLRVSHLVDIITDFIFNSCYIQVDRINSKNAKKDLSNTATVLLNTNYDC